MDELILVINPGSTSTKVALYRGKTSIDETTLVHPSELTAGCLETGDELDLRREAVRGYLKEQDVEPGELSAIAARGGVIGRLESGAYRVDEALASASLHSSIPHASNLAAVIAHDLAKTAGIPAYIYDAVCGCGDPDPLYRITGIPEIEKQFLTHVLNSRAVCMAQAESEEADFFNSTYIAAHLGGGITVNLVHHGKILDIVGDDEGAFSPERSGGLPVRSLVRLCLSGKYTEKEMQKKLKGRGGLLAYLGTNSLLEVEDMIAGGNKRAELVCRALALQVAKDIGSLAAAAAGKLDGILLTGGLAGSEMLTALIKKRVEFLAPVSIRPGTFEMEALARGILRVLRGEEEARLFYRKGVVARD